MKKTPTGMIVGLIFIILGILYAGSALNIFTFSIFFPGFWTLFIIVPCFYGLFRKGEDKTSYMIGLIIGICLLINAQDISLHINFWPLLLAIICIVIGVRLVFPKKSKSTFRFSYNSSDKTANINGTDFDNNYHKSESGYINVSALFSGKEIRLDNEIFHGGDLGAVFGGVDLDLRNAIITEDVTINVNAIFGGIDLYVPSNVKVVANDPTTLFGGIDIASSFRGNPGDIAPTVYLKGSCIFGGIDIH